MYSLCVYELLCAYVCIVYGWSFMYVYVLRLWQQETKKQRIQSDFKLQNEDRLVMTARWYGCCEEICPESRCYQENAGRSPDLNTTTVKKWYSYGKSPSFLNHRFFTGHLHGFAFSEGGHHGWNFTDFSQCRRELGPWDKRWQSWLWRTDGFPNVKKPSAGYPLVN